MIELTSVVRMNAISKWRYSFYGRGINIASVTSHEYLTKNKYNIEAFTKIFPDL
jgi:hypothetical protein